MIDALTALIIATALLLGSPGPVTLSLAATGAVFGFRAGMPFLVGVIAGLGVAITLGSVGIGALIEAFPASRFTIQVLGGLYICYLALKIAMAPVASSRQFQARSVPGFRDGFVLNLLNPKAYVAFLALFSKFILPIPNGLASTTATAFVAIAVAIVVDVAWLALGGLLKPLFEVPKLARVLRVAFGLLMVAAVVLAFMPAVQVN